MRITTIEMEGRDGHYAIVSRKRDSETIEVEILLPDYHATHTVAANDKGEIDTIARVIQHKLEGSNTNETQLEDYCCRLLDMSDSSLLQ
jgi:hypothetical protein